MSAVITSGVDSAPVEQIPLPPKISPALDCLLVDVKQGRELQPISDTTRAIVKRLLGTFERMCDPIGEQRCRDWLLIISAQVEMRPSPSEYQATASAIASTIAYLPAAIFTKEVRASFMRQRTSKYYMPSGTELHDYLAPLCKDWLSDRGALAKLVQAPAIAQPPALTQEERDAIVARNRSAMAEIEAERVERLAREAAIRRDESGDDWRPKAVPAPVLAQMRDADPRVQAARMDQRLERDAGMPPPAPQRGVPPAPAPSDRPMARRVAEATQAALARAPGGLFG